MNKCLSEGKQKKVIVVRSERKTVGDEKGEGGEKKKKREVKVSV